MGYNLIGLFYYTILVCINGHTSQQQQQFFSLRSLFMSSAAVLIAGQCAKMKINISAYVAWSERSASAAHKNECDESFFMMMSLASMNPDQWVLPASVIKFKAAVKQASFCDFDRKRRKSIRALWKCRAQKPDGAINLLFRNGSVWGSFSPSWCLGRKKLSQQS